MKTSTPLAAAIASCGLLLAPLAPTAMGASAIRAPYRNNHHDHVVHETLSRAHPSWKRHAQAPAEHMLPIKIGLRQRNLEHMDRFLDDVAHPDSPNYGRHWTSRQVAATFAPAREAVESTVAWLAESGIGSDRIRLSKGERSGCWSSSQVGLLAHQRQQETTGSSLTPRFRRPSTSSTPSTTFSATPKQACVSLASTTVFLAPCSHT